MPTSKELIEMADREWQNREERKGIHDKVSWTSGWISGYLTRNPQAEREKVLDNLKAWCLQMKCNGCPYGGILYHKIKELRQGGE